MNFLNFELLKIKEMKFFVRPSYDRTTQKNNGKSKFDKFCFRFWGEASRMNKSPGFTLYYLRGNQHISYLLHNHVSLAKL